jgi:hypothetical protein
MNATVRRGAVVVLLVLSATCGGSVPTSPSGTKPSPMPTVTLPSPTLTPPTNFPPLSGPARTFTFKGADYRVAEYTEKSRFDLYDNGAFSLDYLNLAGRPYRGSYTEENGFIDFTWDARSNVGTWGATGRLEGDSLKVQYNAMMQMADFEDAVYTRTP